MKNSKEYSKKIQSLFRSLKRTYPKVQKLLHENVVQAIVYAIVSEKFSEQATKSAMKRFAEYFVDMNDLRVSRVEEITEMLGVNAAEAGQIPLTITTVLQAIFNQYHKVSLETMKKLGKRQGRDALEKIEGTNCFIVDYCMLTSLDGHAIPLTEKMIEYLKSNGLVDADADQKDIAGFLTKQISAKEGYKFYALLRHESETGKVQAGIKKKTKTKTQKAKKTKKKTKKKITKKVKKKKTTRKKIAE